MNRTNALTDRVALVQNQPAYNASKAAVHHLTPRYATVDEFDPVDGGSSLF